MQVPAQSSKQDTQNQELSQEMLVLEWIYRGLRGVLQRMQYGHGIPLEIANQLRADLFISEFDRNSDQDCDTREEIANQIEELLTRSSRTETPQCADDKSADQSVLEDWVARLKSMHMLQEAQPRRFARLVRGEGIDRLREFINHARAMWGARFGFTRKELQKVLLEITTSDRFPTSADQQIEFLSRSLAAVALGYRPSTGYRTLAGIVEWCHSCRNRPAIVDVEVAPSNVLRPWCGECVL